MTKKPQRLLLTTILLTVLLSSCAYAILTPSAHAAEMTTQQKGLGMLRDVVGLDLTKYNITTQENSQSPPFLGNVLQENVLYNLTSANSKLKAFYTFANGNLQGMYVLENEGTPSLTKPVVSFNAVESAQGFLSSYQAYTAKSKFSEN